jgi:hypothetical protein
MPSASAYPGAIIFFRLNSNNFDAFLLPPASGGSLFEANSNLTTASYHLYSACCGATAGQPKTIMAISDGANWTMLSFNN